MKHLKIFLPAFLLLLTTSYVAAQKAEVPAGVISALNKGDAGELSSYLNTNVELVIENKNDVFSRQQASGIIADFFRKNRTTGFRVLHQGNKDAASFAIGILKTSTGIFRVYVLTRNNLIQQLRIEPSNDE